MISHHTTHLSMDCFYFFVGNLETRVTMLFVAYCHIVFSASLFDGSLMRNIKGLFTGSEHNTENHKSIDTNSIENQNNLTKKTKQKHY